jgi:hypothetical protein
MKDIQIKDTNDTNLRHHDVAIVAIADAEHVGRHAVAGARTAEIVDSVLVSE